MEEVMELFKKYGPIMSIYENDGEYIAFPETDKTEPLAVFYDKKLGQYTELYFYQDVDNTIPEAVENGSLIYGKELEF